MAFRDGPVVLRKKAACEFHDQIDPALDKAMLCEGKKQHINGQPSGKNIQSQ